jgi:hypothetical protein
MIPRQRETRIRWFGRTYDSFMRDKSLPLSGDNLPSIVAHSFGTYILGYSLLKYENIRFDKVILCGSILPEDFPWNDVLDRGQVTAILNEFGRNDRWSRIVHWFIAGSGASGQRGFWCRSTWLTQKPFHFDHSEYFVRGHMEDSWFEFIRQNIATRPRESLQAHWPRSNIPWGLYAIYLILILMLAIFVTPLRQNIRSHLVPQSVTPPASALNIPKAAPTLPGPAVTPSKFYSDAEKNRISETLYALSLAFTDKALKSVDETASFMELWNAQIATTQAGQVKAIDTKALTAKLNQIRQLEQEFENDWDKVRAKYAVFQTEINPLFGGGDEGGRIRSNFQESMDEISTGISVVAGVQGHDDKSLLELTLRLMGVGPLRTFVNNSHEFGGWVNGCRQRIDDLRRSILNR